MSEALNPRAVPGDNQAPDHAQIVNDRLALDYAESIRTVDKLLDEARNGHTVVHSDAELVENGSIIKRLKDADTRMEAYREAEKQPFLRGGNAVDNFFHAIRDKIGRRKGVRSAMPGAIDILQAANDVWQNAKAAAEEARLEAERLEAARIAREEAAKLRYLMQEAEAARLAAERARKPETVAAKGAIAAAAEAAKQQAAAAASLAAMQADEARLATHAKPADLVRVRGNDASGAGVMITMRQEGYALVTDRMQLNMEALRPYFTDFELQKALNGYAKATGHKVQMAGAEIGFRNRGVTR